MSYARTVYIKRHSLPLTLWLPMLATVFSVVVLLAVSIVRADSGTWMQGPMPVLSIGEATDAGGPTLCSPGQLTYSGYYDPNGSYNSTIREITATGCSTSNALGTFSVPSVFQSASHEFIKPSSNYSYRVLDPAGRERSLEPVPNQAAYLYTTPSGFYGGSSVRIMHDFRSHGDFGLFSYGSGVQKQELAYKFNNLAAPLVDATGTAFTVHNKAFSSNGKWLAMSTGHGFVRVNVETNETLIFSKQ